ncbi:hypothetical protein ESA_03400 [Cronobacter sakazakii ATCC BAA-894]|uniref:Uncharacterized protein n=1 Tax=Cronobacter sakazakii (strain ATCC BAA-894) TaxID=290339 RepID=A7MG80_CROS8|nr:hypothetical protein ESA_03400 [Cronobacter sakazakii ATCC BAA-894]
MAAVSQIARFSSYTHPFTSIYFLAECFPYTGGRAATDAEAEHEISWYP